MWKGNILPIINFMEILTVSEVLLFGKFFLQLHIFKNYSRKIRGSTRKDPSLLTSICSILTLYYWHSRYTNTGIDESLKVNKGVKNWVKYTLQFEEIKTTLHSNPTPTNAIKIDVAKNRGFCSFLYLSLK